MSTSSTKRSQLRKLPQQETKPLFYQENEDVSFWFEPEGWYYGTTKEKRGPFPSWDQLVIAWEKEPIKLGEPEI